MYAELIICELWNSYWCRKNLSRTQNFYASPDDTWTAAKRHIRAESPSDFVSSWAVGVDSLGNFVYITGWLGKGVWKDTHLWNWTK